MRDFAVVTVGRFFTSTPFFLPPPLKAFPQGCAPAPFPPVLKTMPKGRGISLIFTCSREGESHPFSFPLLGDLLSRLGMVLSVGRCFSFSATYEGQEMSRPLFFHLIFYIYSSYVLFFLALFSSYIPLPVLRPIGVNPRTGSPPASRSRPVTSTFLLPLFFSPKTRTTYSFPPSNTF